jgi:hypothetical protein
MKRTRKSARIWKGMSFMRKLILLMRKRRKRMRLSRLEKQFQPIRQPPLNLLDPRAHPDLNPSHGSRRGRSDFRHTEDSSLQ